jgi:hypothetical protein
MELEASRFAWKNQNGWPAVPPKFRTRFAEGKLRNFPPRSNRIVKQNFPEVQRWNGFSRSFEIGLSSNLIEIWMKE